MRITTQQIGNKTMAIVDGEELTIGKLALRYKFLHAQAESLQDEVKALKKELKVSQAALGVSEAKYHKLLGLKANIK